MIADAHPSRIARALALLGAASLVLGTTSPARADKIKNPTAVFAGLDKITGRIISFEVAIDETVQFGALQLTPRVCFTRPPTEAANTTSFAEVTEVAFNGEYRRIFNGWMFAASPGLSGIEHEIYDIWLTDCKGGTEIIVEAKEPDKMPETPAQPPRTVQRRPQNPATLRPAGDTKIDVVPSQGVRVQPQAPSRSFFPTNPGGPMQIGPDAGRSN